MSGEIRDIIAELLQGDKLTRKALLISSDFSMTGAPLALLEMARQMEHMGIRAVMASASDGPVRAESERLGISALVIPELYERGVLTDLGVLFDLMVINTIVNCPAVREINGKNIPVIWWIHEAEEAYVQCSGRIPEVLLGNIAVLTAGPRAGSTLGKYRPWFQTEELLYAVHDTAPSREEMRHGTGREAGSLTFALVGSLSRRKGQDVLLKAMGMLSGEEYSRCRFVFVGETYEEDVGAGVKKAAEEEGSRVEYIRHISRDGMPGFYDSIDCLICASRDDPMPITVTEACMTGRLIICSENAGSAPLLEKYNAGIIYHNDDPAELAECIRRVAAGSPELKGMGANGRKLYEENFTPEIFGERLGAFIDDITGRPAPPEEDREALDRMHEEWLKDPVRTWQEGRCSDSREEEIRQLREELAYYKSSYKEIRNAFFWKISRPARSVLDFLKGVNRKKLRPVNMKEWMKSPLFSGSELEEQKRHSFSKEILFSITVPLYNTPEKYLREMIESVLEQTYGGWELCLADGSDGQHSIVGRICGEYSGRDERIRYRKLERNLGISENTNACLDMASGDYIALFDHDDVLHPAALYEMMRVICEKDADIVYTDEATFISPDLEDIESIHFKPDYAPDNLRANNYMCHFTAFRKSLLHKTGGFRREYDGSQDHDMMLRLSEAAERIEHIPEVLYFWRSHPDSVASGIEAKEYAAEAGRKAVENSLQREGLTASVRSTKAFPCIYRIVYELTKRPLISIIITGCDQAGSIKKCVDSIEDRSSYRNYEIIIPESSGDDGETLSCRKEPAEKYGKGKVIPWKGGNNYSSINNFAAGKGAEGDCILLLNGAAEVISPGWIEEMLMYAQRPDVGAVGGRLLSADGSILQGGVVLGKGGTAGSVYQGAGGQEIGYMDRLAYAQNMTAVSSDCMLIRRDVWEKAGGLDEAFGKELAGADLCMRIRKEGYLIVWTPFAELYHHGSAPRSGAKRSGKRARPDGEAELFRSRWRAEIEEGDPYYNPNLTLEGIDFTMKYKRQRAEGQNEALQSEKNLASQGV